MHIYISQNTHTYTHRKLNHRKDGNEINKCKYKKKYKGGGVLKTVMYITVIIIVEFIIFNTYRLAKCTDRFWICDVYVCVIGDTNAHYDDQ